MIQWLCYNIGTEGGNAIPTQTSNIKEKIKMTRDMRDMRNENMGIDPENCNCSGYTMATVAGCILLCIGIVIYALLVG